jgi:predicted Zn-ribbon and HTH transcriptional regulator
MWTEQESRCLIAFKEAGRSVPYKPSDKEEEYFARLEGEKKKKLAEQLSQSVASQQREELKKLHWMRCPKCGMELQTVKFSNIEIDRCFSCGGTWLDKGEFEKLSDAESRRQGTLASILGIFK